MNIGLGGTFAVGAYFLMLVILGWASRRARKSNSLADFYLAGRGLGVPVLVLTLYATAVQRQLPDWLSAARPTGWASPG